MDRCAGLPAQERARQGAARGTALSTLWAAVLQGGELLQTGAVVSFALEAAVSDYTYKVVELLKVIDGDTVHIRVDLGFGVYLTERFRLSGIDAPELVGATHAKAVESQVWLEGELRRTLPMLWVESTKLDSFRRWLGTFWAVGASTRTSVNARMLELGLAVPFTR